MPEKQDPNNKIASVFYTKWYKVITKMRSDRSMTAHIVLDLHSPILVFGERCTIVYGITLQPANVLSKCALWHFWLKFVKGFFWPLSTLGLEEGSGIWQWKNSITRPWVPISSPLTNTVYLLPCVSYSAGSKSVSTCLIVWPRYDGNYCSRSCYFVERPKNNNHQHIIRGACTKLWYH